MSPAVFSPSMRHGAARTALLSILLAAGPLPPASARPATPAMPVVHDGISPAVQAWKHAVETADVDALRRMNAPDTVAYTVSDNMLTGTEAIVGSYSGMFAKYRALARIEDAHYLRSGNLLVSWGLFSLELQPRDGGNSIVVKGRFSDAARRDKGRWRYVVDHASALPNAR